MTATSQNLDPKIRQFLIRSRCRAMCGDLPQAIAELEALTAAETDNGRGLERLFVTMLHAELLHLNDQDEECIRLFDSVIMTGLEGLSTEVAIIAGYNRQDCLMALWRPTTDFDSLVALARAKGFDLSDSDTLLSAETDAANGDHFKALPGFWQEVIRTFRQGCWMAFRWAITRLAREYLELSSPYQAAWYAVLSQDERLAEQAAQALMDRRDVEAIRQTLERLLANANLQRHFSLACAIVVGAADGIPDDMVNLVAEWLQRRCVLSASPRLAQGALPMAWKAMAELSARLSTEQAQAIVSIAVNHPKWRTPVNQNNSVIERREMVRTLSRLVFLLPVIDLGDLSEHVLPLAIDRRTDHDYADVVNLLCQIAKRAEEPVKRQLGDRLFVPDQVSFLLGQVASQFGKVFLTPERLVRVVEQVRSMILLQVQRLPLGVEPQPHPGGLGAFHSKTLDGTIVVSFASTVEIEAIARQRQLLTEESLGALIQTVINMVKERENFLLNRAGLIRSLATFSDRLHGELLVEVISTLVPLARGEIEEPTIIPPASVTEEPLNPYKMRSGSPAQVRGAALITLAKIEARTNRLPQEILEPLLGGALSDLDPEVRRAAYAAAIALPRLSEDAMMAVMQGLREVDPIVWTKIE